MSAKKLLAHALASALLSSDWTPGGQVAAMARVVGDRATWLVRLAGWARKRWPHAPLGDFEALAEWVEARVRRSATVRALVIEAALDRDLVSRAPNELARAMYRLRGLPASQREAEVGQFETWLRPVLRELVELMQTGATIDELWAAGLSHPRFPRHPEGLRILAYPTFDAQMKAGRWPVPALPTPGQLGRWLGVDAPHLDWLSDARRTLHRLPVGDPRTHYNLRWVPKRDGRQRLIEAPRPRLRAVQRRILREILDVVPPHEAAHGFVRGRSILTHAAEHSGQAFVLRLDLADFFQSVTRARVYLAFSTMGYPAPAARVLADLCTTRTPAAIRREAPWETGRRLAQPHLPQGAPTSPALANLCARRLDVRLSALAASVGAKYSRYADDLTFSGGSELRRQAHRLAALVGGIALNEGLVVQPRKTRCMAAGQRQVVTGLVVNAHPNVSRDAFDRLKAILTNCGRHGPASQNRDDHSDFRAHLTGRVAFIAQVNAARGEKLRRLLEAISWPG